MCFAKVGVEELKYPDLEIQAAQQGSSPDIYTWKSTNLQSHIFLEEWRLFLQQKRSKSENAIRTKMVRCPKTYGHILLI